MKLIDKLKNALFEEEYVEVEEKQKKKPIKQKPIKREPIREEREEKPIAKKIIPPEKKEVKIVNHNDESLQDNHEGEALADKSIERNERKFPLVSDNEFKVEKEYSEPEVKVQKQDKAVEREDYKPKKVATENKKSKPYGLDDMDIPEPAYGTYEKKEDKTYFKPSPIISPIYGILDKNYKKEEIIPKREVRLTSSYARENLDVDEVRQKAYGTLADDIVTSSEIETYEDDVIESNFEDNDLLDLSTDYEKPSVKKVTMGDAEEYFEDLGLEYNIDYKDASKEKATGRRYKEEETNIEEKTISEEPVIVEEVVKEEVNKEPAIKNTDTDDDNLFDLIDSMYDKE